MKNAGFIVKNARYVYSIKQILRSKNSFSSGIFGTSIKISFANLLLYNEKNVIEKRRNISYQKVEGTFLLL